MKGHFKWFFSGFKHPISNVGKTKNGPTLLGSFS